jgi:hypothetical protein
MPPPTMVEAFGLSLKTFEVESVRAKSPKLSA